MKAWLEDVRQRVDAELDHRLSLPELRDDDGAGGRLREAVRYAALGPGKRLRPLLVIAACEATGGVLDQALPAACAVEMLHAYTLVHDDLPAMDDDEVRRGRPTVHIAFDEGLAILAGDALLTEAFSALADLGAETSRAVRVLAHRAGTSQLLAGQARDLALVADNPSFAEIERTHRDKTGALFAASAALGGIASGVADHVVDLLGNIGMAVGVAFQHGDDQLDAEFETHRAQAAASVAALAAEARSLCARLPGDTTHLAYLVECIAVRP